jgi:hypothetical protein
MLICKECGDEINLDNWMPEFKAKLISRELCHRCDYWVDRIPKRSSQIVVNGEVFQLDNNKPSTKSSAGHGGREFIFKRDGSDEIERSTNLWFNGVVPNRFKLRIPDNAVFLH